MTQFKLDLISYPRKLSERMQSDSQTPRHPQCQHEAVMRELAVFHSPPIKILNSHKIFVTNEWAKHNSLITHKFALPGSEAGA